MIFRAITAGEAFCLGAVAVGLAWWLVDTVRRNRRGKGIKTAAEAIREQLGKPEEAIPQQPKPDWGRAKVGDRLYAEVDDAGLLVKVEVLEVRASKRTGTEALH